MVYPRTTQAPHPVYWVIAIALSVIAGMQILRPGARAWVAPAMGQPTTNGGSRGVFSFSGQLSKDTYGVFMVDVDTMTMWTYEYLPAKGCLRLAGARSWQYDRYLENYNTCDLPPEAVEKMVEEQRKYRLQETEAQMP